MSINIDTQDQLFLDDFETMSGFGATANGGVDRQAGSRSDGEQRAWFSELLRTHGLRVEFDAIGNQWGLLEFIPGAPYVVVGSHMDSQPTAGKFDGAYGVLAAAHAAFRLKAACGEGGITPQYNVAVVNWFNEEGSRFTPSMMGSSVFTGKMNLSAALATKDLSGVTVAEALESMQTVGLYEGPEAAFCAEIHIEQGRSLERDGITIGLVHSNWAANKYEFAVLGEQAHTGSTVIADRKDAMLGASLLVVAARELANQYPGVLHTSVGQFVAYPNSPVVVASKVNLLLDLRSADEGVLAAADAQLKTRLREIEAEANVAIEQVASHCWPVTPYQSEGVELSAKVAANLGLSHTEVMTVAGHDSTNMKDICPTIMLFVPSVEGISHNELEFTSDSDMVAGVKMMSEVLSQLSTGAMAR